MIGFLSFKKKEEVKSDNFIKDFKGSLLRQLFEIKREIDPISHEAFIKLNLIAKEVITRRREYDIYGPMIDRIYLDNAIYVKVVSDEKECKSQRVDIKNGFFMLFIAPQRASSEYIRNRLKIAYEALDDKYIKELIRLCNRFKEILLRTQSTLAKSSDMNVEIDTNLGAYTANVKFNITIKYSPKLNISMGNSHYSRDNVKSAGSFRDTKTQINLVVDKNTDSRTCEKLLDDVERYFIGEY